MKSDKSFEYQVAFFIGFILVVMVGVAVRVFADPSVLHHDAWIWLSSIFTIINGLSLVNHFIFRK
ncbi:hypothetical protein COB72_03230 [bacterium]|nr:MAG: hypothetical protein COB72_03230 [bacterium]